VSLTRNLEDVENIAPSGTYKASACWHGIQLFDQHDEEIIIDYDDAHLILCGFEERGRNLLRTPDGYTVEDDELSLSPNKIPSWKYIDEHIKQYGGTLTKLP